MLSIPVNVEHRSYQVTIEDKPLKRLRSLVQKEQPFGRIFAIFDAQVFALHGKEVLACLGSRKGMIGHYVLPPGESAKDEKHLVGTYDWLLSEKIARDDLIIACGGGVTSDLAGYAAATVLRGVRWAAIPTTLIGMIDAAIGGKTGINHPLGKNTIGAFWHPQFVYVDIAFLETLPRREWNAGTGELLKCAGLIGEPMVTALGDFMRSGGFTEKRLLREVIASALAYKAALVCSDERDRGVRQYLNLGHTFAHGIEQAAGYGRLLHGEAVALGLLASLYLSDMLYPDAASKCEEFESLVMKTIAQIPRRRVSPARVIEAMQLDKKRSASGNRLVVLERPGKPTIVDNIPIRTIKAALNVTLDAYTLQGGRHAQGTGREWPESQPSRNS